MQMNALDGAPSKFQALNPFYQHKHAAAPAALLLALTLRAEQLCRNNTGCLPPRQHKFDDAKGDKPQLEQGIGRRTDWISLQPLFE